MPFSNFLFVNDAGSNLYKDYFYMYKFTCPSCNFRSFVLQQLNLFEYFIVLSLSSFASLLLASVADLMSAYIIIEMQTLSFFVLATYKRDSAFSAEAGMKYFIAGSFMSGIFLFGSSFIYGALGTLNFSDLSILLSFSSNTNFENLHFIVIFGVLLVTFTLLFKISAAPFHFMSPDVYDGAPLLVRLFFRFYLK